MSVQITIRNVPEPVRDELAARAAREGQSMQQYLRSALESLAFMPSSEQWVAMFREGEGHHLTSVSAHTIVQACDQDKR